MAKVTRSALAIVAIALIVLALVQMSAGNLMLAGVSFLSASVAMYLRELRGDGGRKEDE